MAGPAEPNEWPLWARLPRPWMTYMGAFAPAQDRAEYPLSGQANPPNKDRHGSWACENVSAEGDRRRQAQRSMLSHLRAGIGVVCPVRGERSGGADAHADRQPSRLDRRDEGLHAEDVHDPGEIIGEHVQGYFGRNLRQGLH